MFGLFVTKSQLEAILGAAGTNLQAVAAKAAQQSNLIVSSESNSIEHDQQVVLEATRRIEESKKALKQSNKVLALVSKFI